MIIRCIRCKKQFEQKRNERVCGSHRGSWKINRKKYENKYRDFWRYKHVLQRNFLDPLWQTIRLFNDEEYVTRKCRNDSTIEKRLESIIKHKKRQTILTIK